MFYCDENFIHWSTRPPVGDNKQRFENFSERFKRIHPGYYYSKCMHIRARPGTTVLNQKTLTHLFRSKDVELWEKAQWMFEGEFKFLDGEENRSNKIAFSSFPRSGNTFMRKYCELLTGVQTGADNTPHVNVILQMSGMKGEDTVNDTTWIVKTHSPYIMPFQPVFTCNKNLVVVRNPLDVIISWYQLVVTGNHALKVDYNLSTEFPETWDWWLQHMVKCMATWY